MRCPKCGGESDEVGSVCNRCAVREPEIKVLSPDERDDFNGLTIQQGNEREPGPDYPPVACRQQPRISFRRAWTPRLCQAGLIRFELYRDTDETGGGQR